MTTQTKTERQEAIKAWTRLMLQPDRLAIRARQITGQTYGIDAMRRAQRVINLSNRANKVAQLGQLIALVVCECEPREAAAAWKALSPDQQQAANAAIERVIKDLNK